jgi:hypothetical protein
MSKVLGWNRKISKRLVNRYPSFFSSPNYADDLKLRIAQDICSRNVESILEVGGIDRPLLERHKGYAYDGLDIESREDCYSIYDNFHVQSVEVPIDGRYDMVISITLLEHVPDNEKSIQVIFNCLKSGAWTHHYIPSKWHPYSLGLRIIGPKWQRRLIPILRPGTEHVTGYPAFFDYCSVAAMTKLFNKVGFLNINAKPYYRANDYFAWFFPAFLLVTAFEWVCSKLGWSIFASGFVISAKKA